MSPPFSTHSTLMYINRSSFFDVCVSKIFQHELFYKCILISQVSLFCPMHALLSGLVSPSTHVELDTSEGELLQLSVCSENLGEQPERGNTLSVPFPLRPRHFIPLSLWKRFLHQKR